MLNVINFRLKAFLVFLFFLQSFAQAQYWEAGGFIGGSNYNGDLARHVVLPETNLSFGAFGKYNMSEYVSWRFGVNYAKVSGGDYNFENYQYRNLSFFSHLWELDNRLEFNFVRFGTGVLAKRSSSFLFAGINLFYFNPKAEYNGNIIQLHPLGTEGQMLDNKKNYSRVNVALPIGLGYKYSLSANWVLGVELGVRKTFTDYLDDVSGTYPNFELLQANNGSAAVALSDRSGEINSRTRSASQGDFRGDPAIKDWYYIGGFTLSYRFSRIRCTFSNF
ncbi:MAG TPA: hypothetical protein DIW47_04325 [Bacteroidetes bacterium]|nr:hypothetical protein [Bacteroidota bacterium]